MTIKWLLFLYQSKYAIKLSLWIIVSDVSIGSLRYVIYRVREFTVNLETEYNSELNVFCLSSLFICWNSYISVLWKWNDLCVFSAKFYKA